MILRNKTMTVLLVLLLLTLGIVGFTSAQTQTSVTFEQYVVQPGDTLSKIASQFCTTWQEVYYYNASTIGSDPNAVEAGMVLTIPNRCTTDSGGSSSVYDRGPRLGANGTVVGNVYYAAPGDNLFAVAQRFGVRLDVLQQTNGIQDPNKLDPGQPVVIPGLTSTPPAQPPVGGNVSHKTFAAGECTLTPITGAPYYSYPGGPQMGQFPGGAQYPTTQGVRLQSGEYWYATQLTSGSSTWTVWMREQDTATQGNCRW